MSPHKQNLIVDSFLRVGEMSMYQDKWFSAEQWVEIMKCFFSFDTLEKLALEFRDMHA